MSDRRICLKVQGLMMNVSGFGPQVGCEEGGTQSDL